MDLEPNCGIYGAKMTDYYAKKTTSSTNVPQIMSKHKQILHTFILK